MRDLDHGDLVAAVVDQRVVQAAEGRPRVEAHVLQAQLAKDVDHDVGAPLRLVVRGETFTSRTSGKCREDVVDRADAAHPRKTLSRKNSRCSAKPWQPSRTTTTWKSRSGRRRRSRRCRRAWSRRPAGSCRCRGSAATAPGAEERRPPVLGDVVVARAGRARRAPGARGSPRCGGRVGGGLSAVQGRSCWSVSVPVRAKSAPSARWSARAQKIGTSAARAPARSRCTGATVPASSMAGR